MTPTQRRYARDVEIMASRIVRKGLRAQRTLPEPIERFGLAWYHHAREALTRLADETGYTVSRVTGAAAALSPQVSWLDQLRFLPGFLRDPSGARHPGFSGNLEKARAILDGGDPRTILGGPKVRAFYLALLGDLDAVVIDRHAWAVAADVDADVTLTERRYRAAAEAFRWAARDLGLAPARLQSLLWVDFKVHPIQYGGPSTLAGLGLAFADADDEPFRPRELPT